jgi:hypothetical protein
LSADVQHVENKNKACKRSSNKGCNNLEAVFSNLNTSITDLLFRFKGW